MALSAGLTGSAITKASSSDFIPELWSDDIIAAYKANLVVGNLVSKINHNGQKGDTIHIPKPTRGTATAKAAEGQVTIAQDTHGTLDISINSHYEYSKLIEDIVEVQALDSLRRFYTDDGGYALARQVDWDLHLMGKMFAGWDGNLPAIAEQTDVLGATVAYAEGQVITDVTGVLVAWDTAAAGGTGNALDITDIGMRHMIQKLDDADVPQDNRVLVVPPSQRNALMGIDRFVSSDFGGGTGNSNTVKNGIIGQLYGVDVYVSTACPVVVDGNAAEDQRACMFFHKDAVVFVEQMSVRSQTQYKQEYLADLMTTDTIYGKGMLRQEAGIALIVPA